MKCEHQAPPGQRPEAAESEPARKYQAPELQEYGSLKKLTRTLSTLNPGDTFGASFAV